MGVDRRNWCKVLVVFVCVRTICEFRVEFGGF